MDAEGGGMLANSSLSTLHFFYLPPVSLSFNRIGGSLEWNIDVSSLRFENWPENDQSLSILTSRLREILFKIGLVRLTKLRKIVYFKLSFLPEDSRRKREREKIRRNDSNIIQWLTSEVVIANEGKINSPQVVYREIRETRIIISSVCQSYTVRSCGNQISKLFLLLFRWNGSSKKEISNNYLLH